MQYSYGGCSRNRRDTLILFLVLAVQVLIFAPHAGRGFISDDYTWLTNVVEDGEIDWWKPFSEGTGFYRPLVSLSFGIQYRLHGLSPGPYGWFNLILHLLNIVLVYRLLLAIDFTKVYALPCAILFALNAKAVTMAVGWISGRTTLLHSFFLLAALLIYVKQNPPGTVRHPVWTVRTFLLYSVVGILHLAALLSKECAVFAPLFVFFYNYSFLSPTGKRETSETPGKRISGITRRLLRSLPPTLVFIIPLVLYLSMRFHSNAFTPANAPFNYRYSAAPGLLLRNLVEYVTRAGMPDLLIIIFLLVTVVIGFRSVRRHRASGSRESGEPMPSGEFESDRSARILGAGWFVIFILPMFPLPGRSDLYVYLPQVGLHLILLTLIVSLWKRAVSRYPRILGFGMGSYGTAALLIALLLTWSVYNWNIAARYGKDCEAGMNFAREVIREASMLKPGSRMVILEKGGDTDPLPSQTVKYGFNSLLKLHFPHRSLSGIIVASNKLRDFDYRGENRYFYSWENGRLSLSWHSLNPEKLPFFFFPRRESQPPVPVPVAQPVKPANSRPRNLKKRKERLRKLKLN
jgi:hypothetical protein